MDVDLKLTVSPKKTKSSKTTISVETGENAESASRRCQVGKLAIARSYA